MWENISLGFPLVLCANCEIICIAKGSEKFPGVPQVSVSFKL
jgi:hypothetical protein